jgi:hypothetical protein
MQAQHVCWEGWTPLADGTGRMDGVSAECAGRYVRGVLLLVGVGVGSNAARKSGWGTAR